MDKATRRSSKSSKAATRKSPKKMWGYHLTVDAGNCDPEALRSKATIAKFIKELVPKIGMVPYGKPQIIKFGTGHTQGYTLVQLIETSDITAHFSEGSNEIYLDVFSCKTFDPKDAIAVFNKYFKAGAIRKQFRVRQAPRS